jgi:hypothetical protein
MAAIADIGTIGPYHADVEGEGSKGAIRGPFKVRDIPGKTVPTYPCLWRHTAERERTLSFEADMEAVPLVGKNDEERQLIGRKVAEVWDTACHLHFNQNFRFNSQSTAFQFTPRETLGGRAWLAVKLGSTDLEKVACLWGNCSLGLLVHWFSANRQQSGRGNIGKNQLALLPFLNVKVLAPDVVAAGVKVFDDLCETELLPLHELASDPARAELDRRFLTECLGLSAAIVAKGGPVDLLRLKLSQEPSVRGHKD